MADLDWTVVRPAGLTNNSVTDKQFTVREDYHVRQTTPWDDDPSLRELMLQVAGAAGRIARADVARFMLSSLASEENIKKGVAIAV